MEPIKLIDLLDIIDKSIEEMDSEYKRIRFNLVLIKLRKKLSSKLAKITPIRIIQKTGRFFDLPEDYYKDKTRERNYINARQQSMYIIREMFPKKSLKDIGWMYNKDHATVLHAIKNVNNLLETDKKYKSEFEKLLKLIK